MQLNKKFRCFQNYIADSSFADNRSRNKMYRRTFSLRAKYTTYDLHDETGFVKKFCLYNYKIDVFMQNVPHSAYVNVTERDPW